VKSHDTTFALLRLRNLGKEGRGGNAALEQHGLQS
jgi:hypothetical protein